MPRKAMRPQVLHVVGGCQSTGGFVPQPQMNMNMMAGPPLMDPLSTTLLSMGANPYVIGIFYMILNLGGRYLTLELTKRQEWFLSQPIVRPLILFSVLFISTRNFAAALYMTIGILAVLWVFANENSQLCLIPSWRNSPNDIDNDKAYEDAMKKIQHNKGDEMHPEPHHDDEPPAPQQGAAQPPAEEEAPPQQEEPQQENSPDNQNNA